MERMHSAAGPPLICSLHVQGLGRGKAPPKAVQVKAVKAAPPQAVSPIPELDLKVLISSKVSPPPHPPHSSSLTLPSTAESWDPRRRMHPAKVTRRKVSAVPPFTPVFSI
jgi:hypothetical protein